MRAVRRAAGLAPQADAFGRAPARPHCATHGCGGGTPCRRDVSSRRWRRWRGRWPKKFWRAMIAAADARPRLCQQWRRHRAASRTRAAAIDRSGRSSGPAEALPIGIIVRGRAIRARRRHQRLARPQLLARHRRCRDRPGARPRAASRCGRHHHRQRGRSAGTSCGDALFRRVSCRPTTTSATAWSPAMSQRCRRLDVDMALDAGAAMAERLVCAPPDRWRGCCGCRARSRSIGIGTAPSIVRAVHQTRCLANSTKARCMPDVVIRKRLIHGGRDFSRGRQAAGRCRCAVVRHWW